MTTHTDLVALAKDRTVTKTEVGYATDGPFRCGRCEYFQKPSGCQKVAGYIRAEDCCDLFQAAKG